MNDVPTMTLGGWLFFGVSMALVWGLTIWCYWQILTAPDQPEED